jgi:hypothetical protein
LAVISVPKIDEFPTDGRYWRVDWLGALAPNPTITTELLFEIVISPYRSNPFSLPQEKLASVKPTASYEQRVIKIGVGQLPFISVGSIWKDGIQQNLYAGVDAQIHDLDISLETALNIKAGRQEGNSSIIPKTHYSVGDTGIGSNLVAIEHKGDPFGILIPRWKLFVSITQFQPILVMPLLAGLLS